MCVWFTGKLSKLECLWTMTVCVCSCDRIHNDRVRESILEQWPSPLLHHQAATTAESHCPTVSWSEDREWAMTERKTVREEGRLLTDNSLCVYPASILVPCKYPWFCVSVCVILVFIQKSLFTEPPSEWIKHSVLILRGPCRCLILGAFSHPSDVAVKQ